MITRGQVLDAYDRITKRPGATVRVWHLREEMGWPAHLDQVLVEMHKVGLIVLSDDQYGMSDAERDAAVNLDGQDMHLMLLGVHGDK